MNRLCVCFFFMSTTPKYFITKTLNVTRHGENMPLIEIGLPVCEDNENYRFSEAWISETKQCYGL